MRISPRSIVVRTADKRHLFKTRDSFVEWLCDPTNFRPKSLWLSPNSIALDDVLPLLLDLGYEFTGKYSNGITSLQTKKCGKFGAGCGRTITIHSLAKIVEAPTELSPAGETDLAYASLAEINEALAFFSVELKGSIARVAKDVFAKDHAKRMQKPSFHDNHLIRRLDAYAGGRIESFVPAGTTHTNDTQEIWDIDINEAYVTAMLAGNIPTVYSRPSANIYDDATFTQCFVYVPENATTTLRMRAKRRTYYPTGLLFGAWTGEELRTAEACGSRVARVIASYKYETSDEFIRFAERLSTFRSQAKSKNVAKFAKALAVQFVGALARNPIKTSACITKNPTTGYIYEAPCVYTQESMEYSSSDYVAAAATITGRVRSWMAALLHALRKNTKPLYVHTDGIACLGEPSEAIAASRVKAPFKLKELSQIEIWAANRRIETDLNGEEKIASAGISKTLTRELLLEQIRHTTDEEEENFQTDIQEARNTDGRPLSIEQIDEHLAKRIKESYGP